jgi:hypothetical protein
VSAGHSHPEPAYVVVLTTPGGHRVLSHASLMSRQEAEYEADQWRHNNALTMKLRADVREVAT